MEEKTDDLTRGLRECENASPNGELVIEEPDDLRELRFAGHELISAIYEYLRFAIKMYALGEDEEYQPFEGRRFEGAVKTGAEYLKLGFDDPEIRLECLVRSCMAFINDVIGRHERFEQALTSVRDELAGLTDELHKVSGFEARSYSAALEQFAFYVVRWSWDILDFTIPESERDPELPKDVQHGVTASSWYPLCRAMHDRFNEVADTEDRIHEAIEQELENAWDMRLLREEMWAAQMAEEGGDRLQGDSVSTPSEQSDPGPPAVEHRRSRPNLSRWAVAIDDKNQWSLWHRLENHWIWSAKISVPRGNPSRLLNLMAECGGAVTAHQAAEAFRRHYPDITAAQLQKRIRYAWGDLRKALRSAIAKSGEFSETDVPDPICKGSPWRAAIEVGYVFVDDNRQAYFTTRQELDAEVANATSGKWTQVARR